MLTIRVLGNPAFTLHNQSLTHLVTGRSAALLVYLAFSGQPQPRPLLTDLLWENVADAQARTNLRYLLSNLRKAVGDYVIAQGESITFNRELSHWVDVSTFTTYMSTAASAEPEILQALLKLYTGEFMAGFQIEDAPRLEQWLLTQRRHLHDLVVQGLRLRTHQHLTQGEYAEGLAINHYLLTLEPWREEAHQQRMLLLAHSGQRSAALQQYTRCCQALAEELDVQPMPQTTNLYEQIKSGQWFAAQAMPEHRPPLPVAIAAFATESSVPRQHSPALAATPPAPPPPAKATLGCDLGAMPEAAHFAGRHAELGILHSWVGQEQSRLIALLGVSGQGKTALAATFVQDVLEDERNPRHGFSQVIWRSLAGAPTCAEILQGWLRQLATDHTDAHTLTFDELITRLFAILQTRRCLLVLDGVEEILNTPRAADVGNSDAYRPGCEGYATLLRLFFQRRHRSCLLLTSRVRPTALPPLEERQGAFHTLALAGLTLADGAALLAAQHIIGDAASAQQLHGRYAGNPLLLTQATNLIYELFDGDAGAFLREGLSFLGDIGVTLVQQLAHLAPLEQQILHRLAQAGQTRCRQMLYEQLTPSPAKCAYFQALQNLQRAFLLQPVDNHVALPPLLITYLAECPLATFTGR